MDVHFVIAMYMVPGRLRSWSFRSWYFGLDRFGQFWEWVVSALAVLALREVWELPWDFKNQCQEVWESQLLKIF